METKKPIVALAAGAHPDDIEFTMAGTLLLLKEAGAEIHMWNLSNGNCGSQTLDTDSIIHIRGREARESAELAGAVIHPPITGDITILYENPIIRKVSAVIRAIKPNIMLVPSPEDYMEDHQTASRLLVTGAFTRGMPNYITDPPADFITGPVAIYHGMPHGLRDGLRRLVRPGHFVDIGEVLETKRAMLAKHRSQKDWLDASQYVGAYLDTMESMAKDVGVMSGRFTYAEGWRRRSHWGFADEEFDPLTDLLGDRVFTDPGYEASLGVVDRDK